MIYNIYADLDSYTHSPLFEVFSARSRAESVYINADIESRHYIESVEVKPGDVLLIDQFDRNNPPHSVTILAEEGTEITFCYHDSARDTSTIYRDGTRMESLIRRWWMDKHREEINLITSILELSIDGEQWDGDFAL